jgi:membrane-bound serine protease (ClpP class)
MTAVIIGLLLGGFLLLLAEVFLPGGIIGAIGGVMLAVAVVLSYMEYGALEGTAILAGTTIGGAALLYVGLRILPDTRMGRKILLSESITGRTFDSTAAQERGRLVGREGVALTDLRPAGRGKIDGKRWDVVSDGGYISKGDPICVVRVEGARIVVSQPPGSG